MKVILKPIAAAILLLNLTACDKSSTSVSAEQSQSNGFKGEFSQSQNDSKSATSSVKSVSKTQMLTSIVTAAQKTVSTVQDYFLTVPKERQDEIQKALDYNNDYNNQRGRWMNGCDVYLRCDKPSVIDIAKLKNVDSVNEYRKSLTLPSQVDDWFEPMDALLEKGIKGDNKSLVDFLVHYQALNDFLDGVESSGGWIRYSNLNDDQAENVYINIHTRLIMFSNLLVGEIVRKMPKTFNNPADIRHDFLVAFLSLPTESIIQIYTQAGQDAFDVFKDNKTTVDHASGKGTSWIVGSEFISGQQEGWTWKKGGQTFFGQGYINGELKEIELASGLEVSKKEEKGNRLSKSTDTGESVKGSATVK